MTKESDLLFNPIEDLGNGIDVEEMKPIYFDEEALIEAPQQVFRLNTSGNRYYYTFPDEHSEPQFFVSVTTFIGQTLPTSPHLIKWAVDNFNSTEEKNAYVEERAKYGTFMHTQIADFLINRKYDLDKLRGRLRDYIESEQLPADFIHHADELKKDMLAFAQFCIDTNLKPLAIEIVLTHPTDGYAGAIDLACEFDGELKGDWGEVFKSGKKKGQPRITKKKMRVSALMDFKSGRKGFWESSQIQLGAYREMWNARFPDYPINNIFNWSPKEWRGSVPTYNLEDQSNANSLRKLPHLVELAKIENHDMSNTVVSCSGMIEMEEKVLDSNIQEFTLSELVKSRKEKKDVPEESEQLSVEEIAGEKAAQVAAVKSGGEKGVNTPEKKETPKKEPKKPRQSPDELGI